MKQDDNILNKFGNKRPFSVPENYFENFAVEMEKQIAPKKGETKTVPFITKLKPFLYAAAMFALVFTVGNYLTKSNDDVDTIMVTEIVIEQNDLFLTYLDEDTLIEYLIEFEDNNL